MAVGTWVWIRVNIIGQIRRPQTWPPTYAQPWTTQFGSTSMQTVTGSRSTSSKWATAAISTTSPRISTRGHNTQNWSLSSVALASLSNSMTQLPWVGAAQSQHPSSQWWGINLGYLITRLRPQLSTSTAMQCNGSTKCTHNANNLFPSRANQYAFGCTVITQCYGQTGDSLNTIPKGVPIYLFIYHSSHNDYMGLAGVGVYVWPYTGIIHTMSKSEWMLSKVWQATG